MQLFKMALYVFFAVVSSVKALPEVESSIIFKANGENNAMKILYKTSSSSSESDGFSISVEPVSSLSDSTSAEDLSSYENLASAEVKISSFDISASASITFSALDDSSSFEAPAPADSSVSGSLAPDSFSVLSGSSESAETRVPANSMTTSKASIKKEDASNSAEITTPAKSMITPRRGLQDDFTGPIIINNRRVGRNGEDNQESESNEHSLQIGILSRHNIKKTETIEENSQITTPPMILTPAKSFRTTRRGLQDDFTGPIIINNRRVGEFRTEDYEDGDASNQLRLQHQLNQL